MIPSRAPISTFRPDAPPSGWFARAMLIAIRAYQRTLSPVLGNVCRFHPSCSRYAFACIEGQGALRGGLLSLLRLCKCHPFHPGGVDLPPPPRLRSPHPDASASDAPERRERRENC